MAASDQADDLLTKLSGISAMLHTISGTTLSLSATPSPIDTYPTFHN